MVGLLLGQNLESAPRNVVVESKQPLDLVPLLHHNTVELNAKEIKLYQVHVILKHAQLTVVSLSGVTTQTVQANVLGAQNHVLAHATTLPPNMVVHNVLEIHLNHCLVTHTPVQLMVDSLTGRHTTNVQNLAVVELWRRNEAAVTLHPPMVVLNVLD